MIQDQKAGARVPSWGGVLAPQRRASAILAPALWSWLITCSAFTFGKEPARELPTVIVRDLCQAYEGKPAFDSKGETTQIDCDWIRRLSIINQPTLVESYREILDKADTLADLRNAKFPPDIDCGRFEIQTVGDNRAVVCQADPGDNVPYVFLADSGDRILRMETVLDYKSIYRDAMRRSVVRGKISKFYEAYVDLNTDLIIAKLRYTASPLDSVTVENGRVSIVMSASRNPPPDPGKPR
jgi:hypothetical protein